MRITLRRATADDECLLFHWRNEPDTVRMSETCEPVNFAIHQHWFRECLRQDIKIFIAELWNEDGTVTAVGMGRITEPFKQTAKLSFSVDPAYRGNGYGGEIVRELITQAMKDGYTAVLADVRRENAASLITLLREGFTLDGDSIVRLKHSLRQA